MDKKFKTFNNNNKFQISTNKVNKIGLSENSWKIARKINKININLTNVSRTSKEADYSFFIIAMGLAKFNKTKLNYNNYTNYNNYSFSTYFNILSKIGIQCLNFNIFNCLYTNFFTFNLSLNFLNFSIVEKITNCNHYTFKLKLFKSSFHSYQFINHEYYNWKYFKSFRFLPNIFNINYRSILSTNFF